MKSPILRALSFSPRRLAELLGLALALALVAGCAPSLPSAPADQQPSAATASATDPAPLQGVPAIPSDDPRSKGSPDAPVVIVEYSDFQCPYCSRWVQQTFPTILKEYIETGKVRLVFRDFPLDFHQNARGAAVATRCAAEQGAYWPMHDALFARQAEWSDLADPRETFVGYAGEIGLDREQFRTCLDSGRFDQAIEDDIQAGLAAGVTGTPSFVINGQLLVGAQPASAFRKALDTILAGGSIVEPTPTPNLAAQPTPVTVPLGNAPVKGSPNAPITIVEYSDYQCPFCQRFTLQTLPALLQEYVEKGQVRLVFKDFPLNQIHPQAQKAAEAARCVRELAGNDDAYWQMHDLLFAGQGEWSGQANANAIFADYAVRLGVERSAFDACLSSGRHEAAVLADLQEGLELGVRGTPTFFINGQIFMGAQPLQNFRQAIATVAAGGNIVPPPEPTPTPVPTPAPLTRDVPLDNAAGIKGRADAPVTIVEYTDYQCPFCQRHFLQTMPQLQRYIDEGTVKYVVKDFPLNQIHPQAQKAAEAARCAGAQGAFWEMHDLLFNRQQQWSGKADAVNLFKGYARELRLNEQAFAECLDSGQFQAVVEQNLIEGVEFGVRGTPGFFVNRVPLPGAYPIEYFQALIEQALGR
ncbi:MAG: DsbA family protein [Caldilineales bacterium]|nr:DsbA family protein [Caldilineales bacterium]MDW8316643.1 thioredoxin domain-containing protein [Anaerolineae bacterium]